ncbi:hypothetical protein DPMN_053691 [Dreissena polymorpha]|uniref:Uncharacterized protein n=1 Tax=Dreissena polymorpha TaxID=45954 RepID=A0A9D4CNV1_DREPO|nr:hypothetical protein DPMN_053691 [Dreissena polymorpha]
MAPVDISRREKHKQEHRLAGADRSSIFFLKVKGLSFSITKEGGCGGVGVVVIWEGMFHQIVVQFKGNSYNGTTLRDETTIHLRTITFCFAIFWRSLHENRPRETLAQVVTYTLQLLTELF